MIQPLAPPEHHGARFPGPQRRREVYGFDGEQRQQDKVELVVRVEHGVSADDAVDGTGGTDLVDVVPFREDVEDERGVGAEHTGGEVEG